MQFYWTHEEEPRTSVKIAIHRAERQTGTSRARSSNHPTATL